MKAIEFSTNLTGHKINIPEKFLKEIGEAKENIRVILLIDEEREDEWQQASTKKFFDGYSEADAIYDNM